MHKSIIPEHAEALRKPLQPPPCPIFDFHMHAGPAESNRDYVQAAREYGVFGAVAMMHDVTPEELRSLFGDFFHPCKMMTMPIQSDGAAWTRKTVRTVEDLHGRGAECLKFKIEPTRGVPQSFLDDERLTPVLTRATELGLVVMAHIAQPSLWWSTRFDARIVGTKESYYEQVENVLRLHPDLRFVGVHMGGFPENLDYLANLLTAHPNFYLDTSATKWVVRELGRRRDKAREFFQCFADRILFGSDLVVMFGDHYDYFTSRFHVQRTMWESAEPVPSMIADPDASGPDFPHGPAIYPLALPEDALRKIYRDNAGKLLKLGSHQI
jgi:predicted TIM-barrel fold metal-dependent hydrolase